eukprot:TRINITY_DN1071_c0_g1_i1.p1 TRINITY_DN1071_c0_g1~~TRINITY_DN1071_c0_g1_i1.p1  ORF type:complete len:590 (+),score=124.05 TRINITY_DN1071_c0_g1_i1:345-2114(+)
MNATNLWVLLGLGIAGILLVRRKSKRLTKEDFGAFIERLQILPPPQPPPPKAPHPLTNLIFAVKDIFNIEGFTTGFGNPDWLRTHEPAVRTAPAITRLIQAGATLVGKTVMDEMAYSLNGENKHYGTPVNPAAPSRVPGGSSSGSAVAVAAKLVDFALGTDTAGSVRVPAAFCGILGFRPSHGVIPTVGVVPMAQSFDTVGWFAREPNVLYQVGHALLQLPFVERRNPRRIIIADDCFKLAKFPSERIVNAVICCGEKLFGRQVITHLNVDTYLSSKVPSLSHFYEHKTKNSNDGLPALNALGEAMRLLQRYEFKRNHEEWINTVKPNLGPGISARVRLALETTEKGISDCLKARDETRDALNSLLKDDAILVIPTAIGPPPYLNTKERSLEEFRTKTIKLLCLAGMSGCCQASIPLGQYDKCPLSISLIGKYGGDRFLLDAVRALYPPLQEQASNISKSKVSRTTESKMQAAELSKEKGNSAYKEKQWQKAINFYTEAIKLNGKNATYYSNRAAAYLELRSFSQAEADSSAAINLDKKNVKAYLRRGTAREMLGYYKEALEDFNHALVLEPTNTQASLAANKLRKLFE